MATELFGSVTASVTPISRKFWAIKKDGRQMIVFLRFALYNNPEGWALIVIRLAVVERPAG